jgi:hypothetical protein
VLATEKERAMVMSLLFGELIGFATECYSVNLFRCVGAERWV